MRPIPITIERKPLPRQPEVPHSPQHFQAAQLVEPITGINEHGSAQICILSEELKGSQCPLSTFTPFLALNSLLHLHLKCHLQLNRRLLLCTCCLSSYII